VSMSSEMVVHAIDEDFAIGRVENLVIVLWIQETEAAAIRRVAEVLRAAHRDRNEPVGLLQVVLHGSKGPDQEAREALVEMLRGGKGVIAASAVVYPGQGFLMAAARAFVSGVAMLARPGFPHMVFPTRGEAAEWLARLLPKAQGRFWTASGIHDTVEKLIARTADTAA
jgi:hypothetical protein